MYPEEGIAARPRRMILRFGCTNTCVLEIFFTRPYLPSPSYLKKTSLKQREINLLPAKPAYARPFQLKFEVDKT